MSIKKILVRLCIRVLWNAKRRFMEKLSIIIGKRLKEVRLSKGLRQEDMEKLGISYKYYQKIENGRANVTIETLEKIATVLEIEPRELFELPMSELSESVRLVSNIRKILSYGNEAFVSNTNEIIEELLKIFNHKIDDGD
jgi:transcriptional regulator with XRE-family HTH domain